VESKPRVKVKDFGSAGMGLGQIVRALDSLSEGRSRRKLGNQALLADASHR